MLEPDDGKLSCPVLRGPGGRKAAWLLDLLPFLGLSMVWHDVVVVCELFVANRADLRVPLDGGSC